MAEKKDAADAKGGPGVQMPKILGGRRFSVPNGLDFLFSKKEHKEPEKKPETPKKKPEVHWSLKTRKAERVTGNPKTWVNILKPSEPPAPKKRATWTHSINTSTLTWERG